MCCSIVIAEIPSCSFAVQKWPNIWTLCTIVKDQKDIKNNLHLFAYFLVKPKYHTRIPIMIYVLKNWILFHKWWFVFAQLVKLSTIKILANCRLLTISHQICVCCCCSKAWENSRFDLFWKIKDEKTSPIYIPRGNFTWP